MLLLLKHCLKRLSRTKLFMSVKSATWKNLFIHLLVCSGSLFCEQTRFNRATPLQQTKHTHSPHHKLRGQDVVTLGIDPYGFVDHHPLA